MDPVSTLAFSCNILDMVERGFDCCKTFKELYKASDGLSKQRSAIIDAVDSMQSVIDDLRNTRLNVPMSRSEKGRVDQSLLLVTSRCEDLANDLAAAVEKCRVKKTGSLVSTAKAVVRAMLSQADINKMELDLQQRSQTLHVLLMTCTHRDVSFVLNQIKGAEIQHEVRHGRIMQRLNEIEQHMGSATILQQTSVNAPMIRNQMAEAAELAEEAQAMLNRQLILTSLKFLGNDVRMGEVHEAAEETFSWILEVAADNSLGDSSNVNFAQWMRSELGVFHVTGKPGSGKSTLMKYIVDHARTPVLLSDWSGAKKLVVSKFFLWRFGNRDQKSFRGLTQGLLYAAVRSAPELIEFLFPQYWDPAGIISKSARMRVEFDVTERDVATAFNRLVGGTVPEIIDRFRICFFVDGLDELDEHQGVSFLELRRHILQWSSRLPETLKICVSSRLWPVFEGMASSELHKISLHDLTRNDVSKLVTNTLDNHENFQKLQTTDPAGCQRLIDEVVNDAEGVFLWVTLILRSLEDGLSNNDPLALLQSRVATTPQPLNEFFKTILDTIDAQHRQTAYYLFAMAMRMAGSLLSSANLNRSPDLVTQTQKLHPREHLGMPYVSLLGTSFLFWALDGKRRVDAATCWPEEKRSGSREEMRERLKITAVQVRGRCKGLLVVDKTHSVKFIHRTIPEYLQEYLGPRLQEYEMSDERVGQMLLWTLLAEVKYLGIYDLDAMWEGEAVPCKEVAEPKQIEERVPSVGRDGDDGKNELDLESDSPGEEELDRVQTFVSELESNLSRPLTTPSEFMHEGRMYHLLDWQGGASDHDCSEDESVYSSGFFRFSALESSCGEIGAVDLQDSSEANTASSRSSRGAVLGEGNDAQYCSLWSASSTSEGSILSIEHGEQESQEAGQAIEFALTDPYPILGCSLPLKKQHLRELVRTQGSEPIFHNDKGLSEYQLTASKLHASIPSASAKPYWNPKPIALPPSEGPSRLISLAKELNHDVDFVYAYQRRRAQVGTVELKYITTSGGDASRLQSSVTHLSLRNCTSAMTRYGYILSRLRQTDLSNQEATFSILDALDTETSVAQWATSQPPDYLWAMVREPYFQESLRRGPHHIVTDSRYAFGVLGVAAFLGLHEYVTWRLDRMADLFDGTGFFASYILANAMDGLVCSPSSSRLLVLESLLRHGVSVNLDMSPSWHQNEPNADVGTVWHNYLFELFCEQRGFDLENNTSSANFSGANFSGAVPKYGDSIDPMSTFREGNWPVISTCLEKGGADPDFAVFLRGAGFPGRDTRVDYLRILRCFAEVLPPKDEDYYVVKDVLQIRAEGRRKEREAAVASGLVKRQEGMFSGDGGYLCTGTDTVGLTPPTQQLVAKIESWWAALNHHLSIMLHEQDANPEQFRQNLVDFRVSLEDIINHLRPRDQPNLLDLLHKARLSRHPPPGFRDMMLNLPIRIKTALLLAARLLLLAVETLMELVPVGFIAVLLGLAQGK